MNGSTQTDIGANQNTYQLSSDDVGSTIKVKVTFTDDIGNSEGPLTSAATEVIASADADADADTSTGVLPTPEKPRVYGSSMQSGSTTELEIQWRVPKKWANDPPTPITVDSYDLRYRRVNSENWNNGPQNVTVTQATIVGLSTGTRYQVQVRYTQGDVDSLWSKSKTGRTRRTSGAVDGDVRLKDGLQADEGRLEIFHLGKWGTVCDDRFDGKGGGNTQNNIAPRLACQMLGYSDGEYSDAYKRPELTNLTQNKIWLDDLLCLPESTHWTELPATRLDQCNHAGWGLHNCTHAEDAGVRCFNSSTAQAALTGEFQEVPESHEGTEFTFQVAFSEAVTISAEHLRDHAFEVSGGSVTEVNAVDERLDLWSITITPASNDNISIVLEGERTCDVEGAICSVNGGQLSNTVSVDVTGNGLTARFDEIPSEHDGETPFTFHLALSEPIRNSFKAMRENVFEVTGGTVNRARRVDQRSDLWEVTITPSGEADVRIILPSRACGTSGAVCTRDGRGLTVGLIAQVVGPTEVTTPAPAPLTAQFANLPDNHEGAATPFTIEIVFSEVPVGVKNITLRNALNVTNGRVKKVRKVNSDKAHRIITIVPDGWESVDISLLETPDCSAEGAFCTEQGGSLVSRIATRIRGPVAISVADALVQEGPGVALEFQVTFDRAASSTVSVDYTTSDGTATAGADYDATSGTLTFASGERTKTISVRVLDDSHDEGSETMTLTLSNPSGARIADATATGTIENSDHMPKAWLVRFGRTVADQVIDAAQSRLTTPHTGNDVRIAGYRFGGQAAVSDDSNLESFRSSPQGNFGSSPQGNFGSSPQGNFGALPQEGFGPQMQREISIRDLLTGSSFSLTTENRFGGNIGLWGRGAISSFSGREDDVSLKGEVSGVMLGADWTQDRLSTGMMLVHTLGEGTYSGSDKGKVKSNLTGLYPYGRYALNERITLWGVAGYGSGNLTLTPDGQSEIETDINLAMGALGLRGVLLETPLEGGLGLTAVTDAMGVRTTSDAVAWQS